ncbi:MAG: type II toxin-antitoxin system HicB family antitoxin [Clostridia bacterium]|nr:type II toxin-antitoxin system HicB family antitoxin [Clostridia bacterium]
MREYSFMAVFEPGKRGEYSVYFPDLPGCTSWGRNLEHAQEMTHEALEIHLGGMLEDGDEIPAPSEEPEIFPGTEKGYKTGFITVWL